MCEHESFPGFPAIKLLCHNSKIIYGSMKNTVYVGILLKITIGDQKIVTFSYTLRNQFAYQSIHVDEHSVHTIYYVLSTIWATYMWPILCIHILLYMNHTLGSIFLGCLIWTEKNPLDRVVSGRFYTICFKRLQFNFTQLLQTARFHFGEHKEGTVAVGDGGVRFPNHYFW